MRQKFIYMIAVLVLLGSTLAACTPVTTTTAVPGGSATVVTTVSGDPCSPANIAVTTKSIQELMKEFDDVNFVASLTPQTQIYEPVLLMQDVRRKVEALSLPLCAEALRSAATNYMNAVITYLAHFMGGAGRDQINAEILASQNLRVVYESEYARLIGATYVPPPTFTPAPILPTVTGTIEGAIGTPGAAADVSITNQTDVTVNLRQFPRTDAPVVGYLQPAVTAKVIARTEAGDWLLIEWAEAPNGQACVLAELVTVSGAIDALPVFQEVKFTETPTP
jgi:hypothetical protein